jgi:hypothetical protein
MPFLPLKHLRVARLTAGITTLVVAWLLATTALAATRQPDREASLAAMTGYLVGVAALFWAIHSRTRDAMVPSTMLAHRQVRAARIALVAAGVLEIMLLSSVPLPLTSTSLRGFLPLALLFLMTVISGITLGVNHRVGPTAFSILAVGVALFTIRLLFTSIQGQSTLGGPSYALSYLLVVAMLTALGSACLSYRNLRAHAT